MPPTDFFDFFTDSKAFVFRIQGVLEHFTGDCSLGEDKHISQLHGNFPSVNLYVRVLHKLFYN